MNRRQKIIVSVTGIFIVLLALVGLTYAYFLTQITDNDAERSIEIATANLELVYSDGTPEIDLSGITPLYTSEVQSKGLVKTFTISKTTASDNVYAKIKLINLSVPTVVATYDLKWALYKGTTPVATGDFGGKTTGEIVMATNQLINSTTGSTYNLYIWINETGLDQSTMMNKTITAKIDVIGYGKPEETLASKILGNNNANVITTAPNFTSTSTDKGLYVQKDDVTRSEMGFPTYYYRGDVTNNYVKFGEKCLDYTCNAMDRMPLIWRIVRINEDGSIRLINESHPQQTVSFNSNGTADYTDFTAGIVGVVNDWYDLFSTMGSSSYGYNVELDKKIVKSSFCNDISGGYKAAIGRFYDSVLGAQSNQTFVCPPGARMIYDKKGMITADEGVYAGNLYVDSGSPRSSYLTRTNTYWTLTAADASHAFVMYNNGVIVEYDVKETSFYAYPVINLSPDVVIGSGTGVNGDPYIIN